MFEIKNYIETNSSEEMENGFRCELCNTKLENTDKDYDEDYEGIIRAVLFDYECPKCKLELLVRYIGQVY